MFLDRLATSAAWRWRLWAWGDELRVGGKRLRRDPVLTSPVVLKLVALGRYEKPERDLLAHMAQAGLIGPGDRVVEAGGGLGTVTMAIADLVGDAAVTVFEPTPRTATALRENLALNGHSVTVEQAAVVAGDVAEVAFADTSETSSFAVAGLVDAAAAPTRIVVPARALSAIVATLDPTVLVLDVEGAEVDLLPSVADWRRVRAIHLELHPHAVAQGALDAMFAAMAKAGFVRAKIPDFGSHLALLVRAG
ncbi:Methyltransferase FkbM [Rhodovulum sp. PH10]|uniref:FkbM family methyltransferase n=1 Tax=Rhodovulum sp. PH10 TaxID=1187851 RepID=UPI00027C24D3|nr:FkbM family methyltransferase [Rhodovulum sp. PH10]EJW12773.1 Methyltransferase FkbM [Rhodovulum sp. PH10]